MKPVAMLFLLSFLAMAAPASAVTLTGKITDLWTGKPIGDVHVTVTGASGDILGVADSDLITGEYAIKHLPMKKRGKAEVKYELEDWAKHPTRHYILLSEETVHDTARLCQQPRNAEQSAALAKSFCQVSSDRYDMTEAFAILGSMSPAAQIEIATAITRERQNGDINAFGGMIDVTANTTKRVLEMFNIASRNDASDQAAARIGSVVDEINEFAAVRRASADAFVITINQSYVQGAKDEISPEAKASYYRLAQYLQNSPVHSISVEGHANNSGAWFRNYPLATKRAEGVRDLLLRYGVSAPTVTATGMGADIPVNGNPPNGSDRSVNLVIKFDLSGDSTNTWTYVVDQ